MNVYDEVPRASVRKALEVKATENQCCPVCSSEIGTTISLEHDRSCHQCGLKLWIQGRTEDGEPEFRVDMETTPEGRIRKMIREAAAMEAVKRELAGDES